MESKLVCSLSLVINTNILLYAITTWDVGCDMSCNVMWCGMGCDALSCNVIHDMTCDATCMLAFNSYEYSYIAVCNHNWCAHFCDQCLFIVASNNNFHAYLWYSSMFISCCIQSQLVYSIVIIINVHIMLYAITTCVFTCNYNQCSYNVVYNHSLCAHFQ